MSETVVVIAGIVTSFDCSNLEFEEHIIILMKENSIEEVMFVLN